jgi:hypothetical protein
LYTYTKLTNFFDQTSLLRDIQVFFSKRSSENNENIPNFYEESIRYFFAIYHENFLCNYNLFIIHRKELHMFINTSQIIFHKDVHRISLNKHLFIVLICIFCFSQSVFAQFQIRNIAPEKFIIGDETTFTIDGVGIDESAKTLNRSLSDNSLISTLDIPDYARGICVVGNRAYIANRSDGIRVVDISNVMQPEIVGHIKTSGEAWGIDVIENTAYVAVYEEGLQIFNIENLSDPVSLDTIQFTEFTFDVKIVDQMAYVANNKRILMIDLNTHSVVKSIETPGLAIGLDIYNNSAYVAMLSQGIHIIDLQSLNTIEIHTDFSAYDIDVEENIAYMACGKDGIQIFNIENEGNPVMIGKSDIDNAYGGSILGNKLYVTGETALSIFSINDAIIPPDVIITANSETTTISIFFIPDVSIEDCTVSVNSSNVDVIKDVDYFIDNGQIWLEFKPVADQYGQTTISCEITEGDKNYIREIPITVNYAEIILNSISTTIDNNEVIVSMDGKGFEQNTSVLVLPDVLLPVWGFIDVSIRDISVIDNLAYVLSSSELIIIDIKMLSHPQIIGSLGLPFYSKALKVIDNIAYVASSSGFHVINIENPFFPSIVASMETPDNANALDVADNRAYVTCSESGLQIIDITIPSQPSIINTIETQGNAIDVKIAGDLAFVTTVDSINVIDIEDELNLEIINTLKNFRSKICVFNNLLYVVDSSDLVIYDIEDPYNMKIISKEYLDLCYLDGLFLMENVAYISFIHEIVIIDVKTPDLLQKIASFYQRRGGHSIIADRKVFTTVNEPSIIPISVEIKNLNYSSSSLSFKLLSPVMGRTYQFYVSNPQYNQTITADLEAPFIVSSLDNQDVDGNSKTFSVPFSLQEKSVDASINDYTISVYASNPELIKLSQHTWPYTGAENVIDMTPVKNSFGTSTIVLTLTNGNFNQVERFTVSVDFPQFSSLSVTPVSYPLNEEYVATITGENFDTDTRVFLLASEENLTISTLRTSTSVNDISVVGNLAYLANGQSGMKIIDISSTFYPEITGSIETPGYAWGLTVSGDYAYIACDSFGVVVVDIKDPFKPKIIGNIDTPNSARNVAIVNNILYVADGYNGLYIIDISTPDSPDYHSLIETQGFAKDVFVKGDMLYLADGSNGLQLFDISNPLTPTFMTSIDTYSDASEIAVEGDIAYVASNYGIEMINIEDPLHPVKIHRKYIPQYARGIAISKGKAYVALNSGLLVTSIFQNLQILDMSETELKVQIPAQIQKGDYQINVYNPQNTESVSIQFQDADGDGDAKSDDENSACFLDLLNMF